MKGWTDMGYDLSVKHDEKYERQLREQPDDETNEMVRRIVDFTGAPENYRYSIWGMATVRRFMAEANVPDFIRAVFETTNGDALGGAQCGMLSLVLKVLSDDPYQVLAALGKGDMPTEWEQKAREDILAQLPEDDAEVTIGTDACPSIPGTPAEDNPEVYERQLEAVAYWMQELDEFSKFLAYAATQGGVIVA